jgi:hypothetical protein
MKRDEVNPAGNLRSKPMSNAVLKKALSPSPAHIA